MNRFIYTITTIVFVLIAGVTVYMVLDKDDTGANVAAVSQVQEQPEETDEVPVVEETVEEEVEEDAPEVVEEEPVDEDVNYYTYKVVGASWLNFRKEPGMDTNPVASIPRGYTGYVVEMTGHWTLLCADGYVGYCSDNYLEFEQIDASEYPDELKGYDESNAGTSIAEGKIGAVEEANTKSVNWK